MTVVKITKMQGCGNDFVFMDYEEYEKACGYISSIRGTGKVTKDECLEYLSKRLCDRHFAIGADGLIIPFPSDSSEADIAWEYYNSDGTSAQMCGNGMRCFAKYVYDRGIINKKYFRVKTRAGIISPEILENGIVKVNMGKPVFQYDKIPYSPMLAAENEERCISVQDKVFKINPISMGNPHCIIFTTEDTLKMAKKYGPDIEVYPSFPQKTNVEFVKIISKNEIEVGVFERGCGITLACGTGACASTVACILNNLTENNVKVNLPGGGVNVEWRGNAQDLDRNVFLTGPAQYSFTAEYVL